MSNDRFLNKQTFSIFWARLKEILRSKVSTINGVNPDASGNVLLTASKVGAYPISAIRVLDFSIPVSSWIGSGPYTSTVQASGVVENTDCRFELGDTVDNFTADITWTTSDGAITLVSLSKPSGTISGKIILMDIF